MTVSSSAAGPEQTGEPVLRGEQRARAVLAAQAESEGVVPGGGGGALALRGGDGLAGRGERGLGVGQLALGRLVLLGELRVARVQSVDLGLERLVLLLRGRRTLLRLVPRRRPAGRSRPVPRPPG